MFPNVTVYCVNYTVIVYLFHGPSPNITGHCVLEALLSEYFTTSV